MRDAFLAAGGFQQACVGFFVPLPAALLIRPVVIDIECGERFVKGAPMLLLGFGQRSVDIEDLGFEGHGSSLDGKSRNQRGELIEGLERCGVSEFVDGQLPIAFGI